LHAGTLTPARGGEGVLVKGASDSIISAHEVTDHPKDWRFVLKQSAGVT
jgi:hypothetical protein